MSTDGKIVQNGSSNVSQVFQDISTSRLDLTNVPQIVGEGPKDRLNELWRILTRTKIPLYLVGDSGTGKSLTMLNLLRYYEEKLKKPAFYVQLSEEDTKTSTIMGLRLINGTIMPFKGVIARAAELGGIVGIDEITHSTHNMLLMFNALEGGETRITIGDQAISGIPKIIYGSNRSSHAGNIRVPPSFVNRVITYPFDYPSVEDEAIISKDTAERKMEKSGLLKVPDGLYSYMANYIKEMRTPDWPLSSRNVAHIAVLCQLAFDKAAAGKKTLNILDTHFTGTNAEPVGKKIAERIFNRTVVDTSTIHDQKVVDFLQFVSVIGVEKFREIVKVGVNYYADIDGTEIIGDVQRTKMASSII